MVIVCATTGKANPSPKEAHTAQRPYDGDEHLERRLGTNYASMYEPIADQAGLEAAAAEEVKRKKGRRHFVFFSHPPPY